MEKLKVVELFAGVGGFRLGLERTQAYEVVWSNQWEPSTKKQHASLVYEKNFGGKNHSNIDIGLVDTKMIPPCDVLVGGFPCQDYSVASTLRNAKGLIGKKGVLWWTIHKILDNHKKKPPYLILENVDRLLKSPVAQRGRDFAIMLKSLDELGYCVEWRVLNAAEYGMPQRRRRIFLLGYHKSSTQYKNINALSKKKGGTALLRSGILENAFPTRTSMISVNTFPLTGDLVAISNGFNVDGNASPFQNAGFMVQGTVHTAKLMPDYAGPYTVLKDILQTKGIAPEFFIPQEEYQKWAYLKGAKNEKRRSGNGYEYRYSEGSMLFPEDISNPSRTIITGEGGKTPSRFKHVIQTPKGLRRLTPIELERLNMFPDNHTLLEGISNTKRAFFMGNALVIGIVEKIGNALYQNIRETAPN
ncbi:MAG: DNA (cytosine-5-)-methyltransferase [Sediminicola sp.]|tara:strand:- start:40074 stop:41321 length:1248 start_codon:yes stop_codon:yes gene_type:complete